MPHSHIMRQGLIPVPPGVACIVGVGRMEHKIEFSAFEFFFADKTLRG